VEITLRWYNTPANTVLVVQKSKPETQGYVDCSFLDYRFGTMSEFTQATGFSKLGLQSLVAAKWQKINRKAIKEMDALCRKRP